jgi:hypothetical protein
MPAAKLNLVIEQGATFVHQLQLRDGPDIYSPIKDLTGYTARIQLRSDINSPDVILELTTENGRISISPLEGKIQLRLGAAETSALEFAKAVYDMEVSSPLGIVTRVVQGNFSLSRQVTR